MAEVTGLVVGTIGLAALFQTCIELFERFELGRNHDRDYQLACTKIDLLHTRLRHWGEQFRVEVPGCEHPALVHKWTDEQAAIVRSLIGIRSIFQSATKLADKYDSDQGSRSKSLAGSAISSHPQIEVGSGQSGTRLSRLTIVGRRTIWAVRDKAKLDRFIEDLSFLIDGLDKAGIRVTMSANKAAIARKSLPAHPKAELASAQDMGRNATKAAASQPKIVTGKVAITKAKILTKEDTAQIFNMVRPKNVEMHSGRKVTNKCGVVVGGGLGNSKTCLITDGEVIESEDGVVVLGNISNARDLNRLVLANKGMIVAEEEASDCSSGSDTSEDTLQGGTDEGDRRHKIAT